MLTEPRHLPLQPPLTNSAAIARQYSTSQHKFNPLQIEAIYKYMAPETQLRLAIAAHPTTRPSRSSISKTAQINIIENIPIVSDYTLLQTIQQHTSKRHVW